MRGKQEKRIRLLVGIIVVECILVILLIVYFVSGSLKKRNKSQNQGNDKQQVEAFDNQQGDNSSKNDKDPETTPNPEEEKSEEEKNAEALKEQETAKRTEMLDQAKLYELQYDYDKAIDTIKEFDPDYTQDEELNAIVTSCEETKQGLKNFGAIDTVDQISHVFFHSLIADTSKAFDGDNMENGYNYWMTTVSEFKSMLQQMYDRGYVLVSIHDIAPEVTAEDGSKKLTKGEVMLPADKKPFVLSQDDTNYYEYMQTDGFAKRLVIDEDGYPACEIELDGKTVIGRDYDVVPILEKFIEEHPDFSYRGARGIIGVTGYQGVIGYRTNDTESPTYDADVKQAKEVANRLKEIGWEFASHSYGHGHMGQKSAEYVKNDSERWKKEVESIIGPTDIYLFPYGEDIQEGIGLYDNQKYKDLKAIGFNYFCGVCAYPWMQIHDGYVRMTRRNLDGYSMHFRPDKLEDLFDVKSTIDPARPEFKE